jgi:hypothetical protein
VRRRPRWVIVFEYRGTGTYFGPHIERSAIAASSVESFSDSPAPRLLPDETAKHLRKEFGAAAHWSVGSTTRLNVFTLKLDGQDLALLQRSYAAPAAAGSFVFAIGKMDQRGLQMLYRKKDRADEDEVFLATVHLKNGRGFLVTTVTDSAGQWFRIYGFQQGKLTMVYSGGGWSC